MITIGLGLAILGSLAGFQNCSKVKVDFESGTPSSLNGPNGTPWTNECQNTELQTITTPVKLLMIVDTSGSNANSSGVAGSDVGKVMRAGSIEAFHTDYGSKGNFSWGFLHFQAAVAKALINVGGNQNSPKFSNSMDMASAIVSFKGVSDTGSTPYKAAIAMAKSQISADVGTSDTKYIVVFLSDGMPKDYPLDSSTQNITAAGANELYSDVTSLVGLKPGKISFSTVYYGSTNLTASNLMHNMATTGGGQFLDTNANPGNKAFLINSVVTVPGVTCPM